jgi:hypothetical protein
MPSVRVPGFLPSTRGLHFPNAFPHVPNFELELPGGVTVPVGDAANGLCGGMAWTARDLFEAGLPPPPLTVAPGTGPLFDYVAARLLDSFDLPRGPLVYLELMNPALPDHGRRIPLLGRARAWRMVRDAWPRVRADLDRGVPCPLGLVRAKSLNPFDLGQNHQVLAYGYDLEGAALTLCLYDPNYPDDDGVTMSLEVGDATRATPVRYSHGGRVWCFFPTPYRFRDPAPALAVPA